MRGYVSHVFQHEQSHLFFFFTLNYNMSKNAFPSNTASQVLPVFQEVICSSFLCVSCPPRNSSVFIITLFLASYCLLRCSVCIQRGGSFTRLRGTQTFRRVDTFKVFTKLVRRYTRNRVKLLVVSRQSIHLKNFCQTYNVHLTKVC